MNRVGDAADARFYRAERFFAVNDGWYFSTRESDDQGPYTSRLNAEKALVSYIRAYRQLGGGSASHNPLVNQLVQGFEALAGLNVLTAWDILAPVADELSIAADPNTADLYTCCDTVLLAAEALHAHDNSSLAGLPVILKDYSHRSSIRPFPLDGMLVPERLYMKKPSPEEVFCCKVLETGYVAVADTEGNVMQEDLAGLPLDARIAVMMLIGRMRGIISARTPLTSGSWKTLHGVDLEN